MKSVVIALPLIGLIPPLVWFILHLILRTRPRREPFVISHRGAAALAPENTLAGVAQAIAQGASHVEIDVQRSADGVLVVIHDHTVDRTTNGTGRVAALTWDQIRTLRIKSPHTTTDAASQSVVRLASILQLIAQENVTLVLEAKSPDRYPGIERQIARAIQAHGLHSRVIVVSFDHDWLWRLHEAAPDVRLGTLWRWMERPEPRPPVELVDVYWPNVLLDPTLVRRMHAQGRDICVWTVNQVWLMKLLLWLGVDGITTDHPQRWRQAIRPPQRW